MTAALKVPSPAMVPLGSRSSEPPAETVPPWETTTIPEVDPLPMTRSPLLVQADALPFTVTCPTLEKFVPTLAKVLETRPPSLMVRLLVPLKPTPIAPLLIHAESGPVTVADAP